MKTAMKEFAARDLTLVYAENDPRVSSLRVAERIHPTTRNRVGIISEFVERNRAELERYGNIPCHTGYSGKRGQPANEYLLNEDQVTIVIMRSDSKEAADARYEIVMLIRAYRRGDIRASDITIIDDLFAPKRPTIERGEGNVVHVRHEQRTRFDDSHEPTPAPAPDETPSQHDEHVQAWLNRPDGWRAQHAAQRARQEEEDAKCSSAGFAGGADRWTDHHEGIRYQVINDFDSAAQRRLKITCNYRGNEIKIPVVAPDGKQIILCINEPFAPIEVILRNYAKLGVGPYAAIGEATLRHILA